MYVSLSYGIMQEHPHNLLILGIVGLGMGGENCMQPHTRYQDLVFLQAETI